MFREYFYHKDLERIRKSCSETISFAGEYYTVCVYQNSYYLVYLSDELQGRLKGVTISSDELDDIKSNNYSYDELLLRLGVY